MRNHIGNINEAYDACDDIIHIVYELDSFFRRHASEINQERWKGYVKGHILAALNNEHDYVGSNMFTLEDILKSIDEDEKELDEDENEDDEEEEEV
jgi:hypothetical protein